MRVVAVDGSPYGPGKTAAALTAVLAGAASRGADTAFIRHDDPAAVEILTAADAVVLGSPTYRASHTAALRTLLERLDRGEGHEPLAATPVAVVMTGASPAHFLGTRELATTLSGFFGTQVLAPDLFFHGGDFTADGVPGTEAAALAHLHGEALVDLAAAVGSSSALRRLRPLV